MPSPTRPARVVHVMNGAAGGAALTTLDLIAGLAAEGIESSVVCHTAGADGRDAVRDAVDGRAVFTPLTWWNRKIRSDLHRRPVMEVAQITRTWWGLASTARVAEAAVAHRADLVHTNTILTPEGAAAARRLGLPHVWHVREMVGQGHPFRFWFEGRRVARRLAAGADVVVANSHAAARSLGDLGVRDLAVVHNGVRLDGLLSLAAPSGTGAVTVGMVANLSSEWKRHDLFVEMAGRVDRDLAVRFVLVGGGADGAYARALGERATALGLGDRLSFVGAVDGPTDAMRDLDVLVHPCPDESFGRIVIEAMAAGRPVVGVAAGGVGELVDPGRTGLLVEPGDVTGLAAAVERLVRDRALADRFGREGRCQARGSFSVEAMTAGVLGAYAVALDRRSTDSAGGHPDVRRSPRKGP